ncbi:hypothetical protein G7046_g8960 [Stylonectria norvegica]|nr:hypothetical protein G7046_g8960 [Stylonectria norvegica]
MTINKLRHESPNRLKAQDAQDIFIIALHTFKPVLHSARTSSHESLSSDSWSRSDYNANTKGIMVTSLSTPRSSESPMEIERAHRACEKCTRTKKRLTTTCCYDFVYTAPATAVVDPGYLLASKGGDYVGATNGAAGHGQSIFDPNFAISSAMVMALLTSRNINWRESTERYFDTMNPWLSTVHPELFAHKTDGLGPGDIPRNPEVALLLVCMQLVTQYGDSASPIMPEGKEMIKMPAYLAAKRILSLLRGLSPPSIELMQCTVLLGLFEFGHGDVSRAYVTIGDANTMAQVLNILPGKYVESEKEARVSYEDEERRCVYWALFVLDRLIHVDCALMIMPLHVVSPADDDLLPTTNIVWDKDTQRPTTTVQRHPANVAPAVPLGPFQRNCQCAMLYTRAPLSPDGKTLKNRGEGPSQDFTEIDIATRALVEAMNPLLLYPAHFPLIQARQRKMRVNDKLIPPSLLLSVYCRHLYTVDPKTIHAGTSDVNTLKAIAGLNFTVRIIADTTTDLNDQLARRPHLLAPCSPVTPYSAYHCLMVLSNFEHVIPDPDVRFHAIYSSLHFFAKRWGVAGEFIILHLPTTPVTSSGQVVDSLHGVL